MGGDHTCASCGRLVGTAHEQFCARVGINHQIVTEDDMWSPVWNQRPIVLPEPQMTIRRVPSIMKPRWWQIRRRIWWFRFWRGRRKAYESLSPAEQQMYDEISLAEERAFLLGHDAAVHGVSFVTNHGQRIDPKNVHAVWPPQHGDET